MIRLGLRLVLASGREALTRLLVITAAVAAGVALLLAVLAEFHAFQADGNRPCWECTQAPALPAALPGHGLAANYSVDFYQGQTIERLDVAALGPGAPVPPGISRLPGPGQYYTSPALAHLLRTVPAGQLGDRFPGRLAGTIGNVALTGPDELVIYVGYKPSTLAKLPGTRWVTAIGTAPGPEVFTPFFRYAFATGVLAVLFPVLILISTATRLAAARREERFAALRLVGATAGDISVIASVDSVISALLGAVAGAGLFLAVQPALATATLTGTRYFASTVTPTIWGYLGLLVAVPLASAIASLLALRRVRISPLGVTRRATPPPPSPWRLAPLTAGIALFIAGALATSSKGIGAAMYPGLLITMIGLVTGGPWLTAALARLCARVLNGASPLLTSRRLADDPKLAFRAVRGLVLAVFLGTIVGALVPTLDSLSATPNSAALSDVLLDTFSQMEPPGPTAAGITTAGLTPHAGAALVSGLRGIAGTEIFPLYSLPQAANPHYQGQYIGVVSCSVLRDLAVLGRCAPGLAAVRVSDGDLLYSDNPHNSTKAFASPANPAYPGPLSALPVQAVLVRVNSAATLERARTYLATHAPPQVPYGPGAAATPPRTFSEAVAIRSKRAGVAQKLFDYAVALTILVAGCSLAVSIGGGLVDRKRPFTLLRVGGTSLGTLSRVVLLEAIIPLAAAVLLAAGIAYGMSATAVVRLAPPGTSIPGLTATYWATLGAGLALALAVVAATLPLLARITTPASIRFE
ncbi:MAG TPA: FtsX-like permease family protein [Streptosporangiaceae bacterium]|nr:FtsX-like permease family protein [Streptosporangiaceae bacterium]